MTDTLQDHIHTPDPYEPEEAELSSPSQALVQFKRQLASASMEEQLAMLSPDGAALAPVQGRDMTSGQADQVHRAAAEGTSGSGSKLPYYERIQQSFGSFDVSGVQSYTGSQASKASSKMGALAYATGSKVAFKGSPDLHTAAHEAAHIVQQAQGVSLDHGVGKSGDTYERHADAVADRVVSGQSAEDLLAGGAGASASSVQRKPAKVQQKAAASGNVQREEAESAEVEAPEVKVPEVEVAPPAPEPVPIPLEAPAEPEVEEAAKESEGQEVQDPEEPQEQEADAVADEATKDAGAGGKEEKGKDGKPVQKRAVQRKAVQFADPPPAPAATGTPAAAPAPGPSPALKSGYDALNTEVAAVTDATLHDTWLRSRIMQQKVNEELTAKAGDAELTTMKNELKGRDTSFTAGSDFLQMDLSAMRAAKDSATLATKIARGETNLNTAKSKLGNLAATCDPKLAAVKADEPLLKTAEEKLAALDTAVAGLSGTIATIGDAYRAADSAQKALSGKFSNACTELAGKVAGSKTGGEIKIEEAIKAKMDLVSAGTPAGLKVDDGPFLMSHLVALEALGQPAHQHKPRVFKVAAAVQAWDLIEKLAAAAPDNGTSLRPHMDAIEGPYLESGNHFQAVPNRLDEVIRTIVQPKIKAKLTSLIELIKPPEGHADNCIEPYVKNIEDHIKSAKEEAAKGRITVDTSAEETRVTEAKECIVIKADFSALPDVPETESEKQDKADADKAKYSTALTRAGDTVKEKGDAFKSLYQGAKDAIVAAFSGKTELTEAERGEVKTKISSGLSGVLGTPTPGGIAESILTAVLELVPNSQRSGAVLTTEAQREANANPNLVAAGAGIQATANTFKVVVEVASLFPGLDLVGHVANGVVAVGKALQKKGEGYSWVEAALFGAAEFFANFVDRIPIIGPLFKAVDLVMTALDAASSMAAVAGVRAELESGETALQAEYDLILAHKLKLEEIGTRFDRVRFVAPDELTTAMDKDVKRMLEIQAKKEVITLRKSKLI